MVNETFARRLKELRTERGLLQSELASKIGLTQRKISKLETKDLAPSPQVIVAVAQFFGVSTDFLLGLDG